MSKAKGAALLVLLFLFTCSVLINILQFKRIRLFQEYVDKRSASGALELGAQVPAEFTVRDVSGREAILRFSSSEVPTVLYVFQPSCIWCLRNSDSVNSLVRQTSGKCRFIGISLSEEGLSEFINEHHLQFPVYSRIPESVVKAMGLGVTPETIVVSPSSTVLGDWRGAYALIQKSLTERFFSVRLPEIGSASGR